MVDATGVSFPGINLSNTGLHQHSYKENNVSRKRGMSEDNEGATGLKKLQTPINLFEDECAFCHSFRISQFHGPMVNYLKGKLVSSDKGNSSDIIYVHKKCMEWSPRVWYKGDTVMNVESEINRASKLRCSRCKRPGAALGCYYKHCNKSFHVPCAMMILDCRWDVENGHVLCPEHASKVLLCDKVSSPRKESDNSPSFLQSQCSVKEEISINCQTEDKQIDQVNTSNSPLPLGLCLDKQGIPTIHKREDQQVDQLKTSSSSLRQGQCLDKAGISADYQREEKQIDQLNTSRNCPSDQWVLLGSALSASEKDSLKEFASWTDATVTKEWAKNVTHVIVGKSAGSTCSRSYEVLMAILFGQWVVTVGWIMYCLEELVPGPETSYEVKFSHDSHTSIDGPKKGRIRAAEGAPKLFSGSCFCLSAYMNPEDREHIQDLIAAAGGQILEGSNLPQLREKLDKNPVKPYFVYDGGAPREFAPSSFLDLHKEIEEGMEYAGCGAQVISHLRVFDAIAAYDAQVLNHKDHFTPYMCA